MKKLFLSACILTMSLGYLKAQTRDYELGLRFGDSFGNNVGIDFAMPFQNNRIHADANFGNSLTVQGLYDWQIPFGEGFMFYPGAGGALAIGGSQFNFGVGGEAGVEYQFPIPLTIGLDYRPIIWFTNNVGYNGEWGLNFRYRFGG